MLEVCVYYSDERRRRRVKALNAGAGQTSPTNSSNKVYVAVVGLASANLCGSVIGRIIIDKNDVPFTR